MTILSDLFDKNGSYQYARFKGKNGVWILIGTESTEETDFTQRSMAWEDTCVGSCLDTFKGEGGTYQTKERYQIKELYDSGKITPVADSLIPKLKSYSSKEWNKKKGRQ